VRDYVHVADLAEGHVAALEKLERGSNLGVYNLGTGHGTSVLELISVFEQATGIAVPHIMAERRPGDVPELYAATGKANRELGWQPKRSLHDMCSDSLRFALSN